MSADQIAVVAVLVGALALFVSNRIRYDLVGLGALTILVIAGIIPSSQAFDGFGHPAVATVAAVLVLTRALQNSGLVDRLARRLGPLIEHPTGRVFTFTGLVSLCSSFMNNIGACALFLPVAIRAFAERKLSPSRILMPISFASLLGGLVTLIGTPPNVIVATIRGEALGEPFSMFDFTPVGLTIAVVGLLYIGFVGWRLVPFNRKSQMPITDLFKIENYIAELRVPNESVMAGAMINDLVAMTQGNVALVGIKRGRQRLLAPSGLERLRGGDMLILEGDSEAIRSLTTDADLEFGEATGVAPEELGEGEVSLIEAVVVPGSALEGRTPRRFKLHARFGINLLAIARRGQTITGGIGNARFEVGDVLLLQGRKDTLEESAGALGILPLSSKPEGSVRRGNPLVTAGIFAAALVATALGVVPVQIAFVAAVIAMVASQAVTTRELYESVDWPIIVLLGSMIPVADALETTGITAMIGGPMAEAAHDIPAWALLALLVAVTMVMSDIMNNAATAVLMAPLALSIADNLGVSADPLLMAVAIGASCTFLTPIGHQSNILVMGPGGYRFGDYWRMGLPLDLIIVAIAPPTILYFWPM